MPDYLLQSLTQFKIPDNPKDSIGFVIAVVLFVALIIFMNVSKAVRNSFIFREKGLDIKKMIGQRVNSGFYKAIKNSGLDKKQALELQKILSSDGSDPLEILRDSASVDMIFNRVYNNLLQEGSFEEVEQKLLKLFLLRNGIEYLYSAEKHGNENGFARGYRRMQVDINCIFYMVTIKTIRVKMRAQKKLYVVADTKYSGRMLDISQGGCAVMAGQSIAIGSFIKIEFIINKTPVAALGKILRLNKSGGRWVYHIRFLKLSKKSIVILNAFIFGYKQDAGISTRR
jgi:hypothetical protein